MKRLLVLALGLVSICANAQYYYQDTKNPEMSRHVVRCAPSRQLLIMPIVNGYNVYKADLHTHTAYSDGSVLPKFRIAEAWLDGLDIIAITDHIEYRPFEKRFYEYLEKYTDKEYGKTKEEALSMVDLNTSVRESAAEAENYGLTLIPGAEITRNGTTVGHFNALFTTDNNTIYDADPVQAVRNAKVQGALVMHNHPGWHRTNLEMTPTEKAVYDEGLVDGVEVMNGVEYYPGIIDRVREKGLFIASNSDIHGSTASDYRLSGCDRPMTLIFARDKSLDSIREALTSRMTLAYGFGTLCGSEELLKDFFMASVSLRLVNKTDKNQILELTNMTSVPFVIKRNGQNPEYLAPLSTIRVSVSLKTKSLKFAVTNMFYGATENPTFQLKF